MVSVALVRQKYTASGGAERFVSRALQALQHHQQLQVHLIARKWQKLEGITAHKIDPFYMGSLWRDWSFARAARAFWTNQSFDLIQSHEWIAGAHIYRAGDGVHAQWLALRCQQGGMKRKIAQFFNPYHHYVKRAEKMMFTHPELKKVICNSLMVKKEIQDYFNLPDDKFSIIYNGVNHQEFSPDLKQHRQAVRATLGIDNNTPVLLFVGSGFARKGLALALNATKPHNAIELIIIGKDKHCAHYQQLAQQLGIANRCHFLGAQNDVKPYLGAADGFILPTLYDPFPNACVEALASGLPVLTSTTCGTAELIKEGKNGFTASALDIDAWSEIVSSWLTLWQHDSQALTEQASNSVQHLTLENMSQQMNELYQNLLENKRQ